MARVSGKETMAAGGSASPAVLVRRREILSAAIAVIARHGLPATTIERVAGRAKVSPGTVMGHFRSKEQLLVATLHVVSREFEAARTKALASAGDDPERAIEAVIRASFDPAVSKPDLAAVWYAFWGDNQARRTYLTEIGGADSRYFAELLRMFRSLCEMGDYAHVDAEAAASGLAGLIEWQWQSLLVEGRSFDRRKAVRLCRAYLHGVFQRHFL